MDNDQRIGMVSILVMRQCDRHRLSQFGSTRLGEYGEWFKTTPKSGRSYATRLGMGRRLTKRTPQGFKRRSAVMIRFVR